MVNISDSFVKKHDQYYSGVRKDQNEGRITSPGSQYLVHLLRGGYLGEDYREGKDRKFLDVGCGSGYNCVSFALMGWQVYGCEITTPIVEHALATVASYGCGAEIVVGAHEEIPFPDEMFDFILSLNVIHYVQSEELVQKAIEECARVLRPGGRIFLSTNHPDNWLLKGRQRLAGNRVRVSVPGDYRDGEVLYLFETGEDLQEMFNPSFTDILVGENRFDFFTRTLRHWIITATKK